MLALSSVMKIIMRVVYAGLAVLDDDKVFETDWHTMVQVLFTT